MSVEIALYSKLNNATAAGERVYPRVPQGAAHPLIRYQLLSDSRSYGIAGKRSTPEQVSMQVDCMARSYSSSKQLATEVKALLDGATQELWGSQLIQHCGLDSQTDFEEVAGDNVIHWVSQRYTIYL